MLKREKNLSATKLLSSSLTLLLLALGAGSALAQHEGHQKQEMKPSQEQSTPAAQSNRPKPAPGAERPATTEKSDVREDSQADEVMPETHIHPGGQAARGQGLGNTLMTNRTGSGTSWQPASTPSHMLHWMKGDWLIMLHGEAKIGLNRQGGERGVTKFESQNWIMPMASRRLGRGTLELRGMFSAEPLTFSGQGSPQLFQSGETYQGKPIVDAQHPHDLVMTLSATYTLPIGERSSWFAYVGFPGEPALGPTAFMHRASASENPSAPLAHHLQDSTHISYGVVTTGFTYGPLKVEASLFNGREPDENRYNLEFNPWNSRSVRLSFAPHNNWTMQWSYGFLRNPEPLEAGDVRRMTASITYNRTFRGGNWATTLVWGRNRENHHNQPSTLNGYTIESTLQFKKSNYLYTRAELVDKNGLLNQEERQKLGIADTHPLFRIGAYTFGAARDFWQTEKFRVALGGDLTFNSKPEILDAVYGENPISYKIFLRFRLGRGGREGAHERHAER
jgi:hypothetical protein